MKRPRFAVSNIADCSDVVSVFDYRNPCRHQLDQEVFSSRSRIRRLDPAEDLRRDRQSGRDAVAARDRHIGRESMSSGWAVPCLVAQLQHAAATSSAAAASATPGIGGPRACPRAHPAQTYPRWPNQRLRARSLKPLISDYGQVLEPDSRIARGGPAARQQRRTFSTVN